jgi:DNA-binding GntR family transcriptional regulator
MQGSEPEGRDHVQTKQDYAYQLLKEAIASGSLLPGQRIVVNRFAHQIGTSAIPVREALLRLEAEGLVTITPHIGAVVTSITGPMIEMTLEALAVMEGYATRLAAADAGTILADLRRHNHTMAQAIEQADWEHFSRANRDFHFRIYSVVANSVLIKTITDLWSQLDSYLSASSFYLMPDRAQGSVAEHTRMIELLTSPSPDLQALEQLAREHKFNTARRLRRQMEDDTPQVRFRSPAQPRPDTTSS